MWRSNWRKVLGLADVHAPAGSTLTLSTASGDSTVDLYSSAGLELVAALWTKVATEHRLMYEPRWLGVPIIQLPEDIVMMQELIWSVQPDVIVECGVAHGGAALFYASLCSVLGKGRVIGIDVEIRASNRAVLTSHPLADRIELIEASSTDAAVLARLRTTISPAERVMVVLDSDHSYAHVLKELESYAPLVSPGSYIVAMDGAQGGVSEIPRGKPEWAHDNPLRAIGDFLASNFDFEVDHRFTRLRVTANPNGYLRRNDREGSRPR